ncbi:MAG: alkaline shock response membrane anchor protein AmaP [Actinomycetota bacterium]|nr:alkaline shock response membrane anchor protein AmaP [Actinomycetota bacterium]
MSSRSSAAVARSAGTDRTLTSLLGLVALAGGVAVLLVGSGVFGSVRANRSVVDPVAVDAITTHRAIALTAGIVAGLLLMLLGLWWALRSLRPERKPDVVLNHAAATRLTVSSGALADAVRADAETVSGVDRARVRLVGDGDHPALRITLWLRQGSDVRDVWDELDERVLARARDALGVRRLPAAVRIELDAADSPRVD